MKRSTPDCRDDVMALMHVTYIGDVEDALALQQDTEMWYQIVAGWFNVVSHAMCLYLMSCSMSTQDTWLRKYHELWGKLRVRHKKFILNAVLTSTPLWASSFMKPIEHNCCTCYCYCDQHRDHANDKWLLGHKVPNFGLPALPTMGVWHATQGRRLTPSCFVSFLL